jgi:hypothetical protein
MSVQYYTLAKLDLKSLESGCLSVAFRGGYSAVCRQQPIRLRHHSFLAIGDLLFPDLTGVVNGVLSPLVRVLR